MAQLPQLLISQAHRDRVGLRRKRTPRSNSARRKASIRPSAGAEITYRKALRDWVGVWSARVTDAIGGLLAGTVEAPLEPVRTDAAETPLQKAIRLGSRPANDAVGTTRAQVRDALGNLAKDAKGSGKGQTRLINTVAERVDRSNAAEFQRVIGVDVASLGSSVGHKLDAFRTENVDLISSIPEQMLGEVSDAVEAAWSTGTRVEDLADLIQKRFDVTESRADLIARDQTLKLNSQLASTRAQASGITRARWCISNDERVRGNPAGLYPNPSKTGKARPDHFHLDGQEYEVGVGLVVSPDGRVCEPGEDYQCRCTAEFILSFLDDPSTGSPDEDEEAAAPEPEPEPVKDLALEASLLPYTERLADYAKRADEFAAFAESRADVIKPIKIYTQSSEQVNTGLRRLAKDLSVEPVVKEKITNTMHALDSAIAAGHTVPGKVFRGLDASPALIKALKSGDFTNLGFMSTSMDPIIAQEFALNGGKNPMLMTIIQRTGVPLEAVTSVTGEKEVLLRAGSRFRVESIAKDVDGIFQVRLIEL